MPQLSLSCPHCHTERIGFAPRHFVQYRPGVATTILYLQCEGCGGGLLAYIGKAPNEVQLWMGGQKGPFEPGDIISLYPTVEGPEYPADIPDNIRDAFLSGLDNLNRPNGANAAAIMFRRSVELGVKKLNPDGKGNLKERIAQLSPDFATPAMKEWATHVRLEANDAAHEEEYFSKKDAETLHTFVHMFLVYAFTLPEMLKKAKQSTTLAPNKITKKDGTVATG